MKRGRLSDNVYDDLVTRLACGEIAVGSRLESEARLAQQFSVSRPIVREALIRLREDGVIVSRQGSGTYVERKPEERLPALAPLASIADVQRCFEVRITLESDAAGLAALRREPADIEEMVRSCEELGRVNSDVELGGNEDFAFHRAIATASKNRFYLSILEQIREHILQGILINRTLKMGQGPERIEKVVTDHQTILDWVEKGDGESARVAMRTHLNNAKSRIFEG